MSMAPRPKDWTTHALMSGEVVDLGGLNDADRSYLDELARDAGSGAAFYSLLSRVQGPGAYPTRASRGMVTSALIASPLFRVAQDIANRAGIAEGKLAPPTNAAPADQMSVPEAAKILGTSRQNVNAAISRGALSAKKIGDSWVVRLEDVRAYQERVAQRPAPGRTLTREVAPSAKGWIARDAKSGRSGRSNASAQTNPGSSSTKNKNRSR